MVDFNSKMRAFSSAFDIQNQTEVIQNIEIQELMIELYSKFSELNLEVLKIGENKFKVIFTIDKDDIEYIKEDAFANKNTNEYIDKIRKEKEEIESELEVINENIKTLRSNYANQAKTIKKLEKQLEKQ